MRRRATRCRSTARLVITGRDIFQGELDYLALKYDASMLCCAGKAYAIDYLLLHAKAQKIIYLDSDIYVFAPVDAMIAKLDDFDFVVTPHIVEPFPVTEKFWQKPSLGALMGAGVYNAGMFGMRRSADARKFLETLKWLVIAPGTFVDKQGAQAEQHMFNWITCFADSVAILRDTAYNVGYWNLHDRAFRHLGGEQWTIDQKPLVAFHYSGYQLARPFDLSHHQNRYNFFDFPALARIRDFYVNRVEANNRGELGTAYGFGAFPSGIAIDGAIMRHIFRDEEVFLRSDVSPWTPEGEAFYCRALLQPVPSTSSLVPILVKRIQELRPDLGAKFGDVSLNPRPLLEWMLASGVQDHGYEALIDRYRPAVPTHYGAMLLSAVHKKWPRVFEGLKAPLREDRREFVARLQEVARHEADQILIGATEQFVLSPIRAIRELYDARPDLRDAFPDVLFDDGAAFAQWLRDHRLKEHFLSRRGHRAVRGARERTAARARVLAVLAHVAFHGSVAVGDGRRREGGVRPRAARHLQIRRRVRPARRRDVSLDDGRQAVGRRAAHAGTADSHDAASVVALARRAAGDSRAGAAARPRVRRCARRLSPALSAGRRSRAALEAHRDRHPRLLGDRQAAEEDSAAAAADSARRERVRISSQRHGPRADDARSHAGAAHDRLRDVGHPAADEPHGR